MIKGAVPGAKGGWVTLKDAIKKKTPDNIPFPTSIEQNVGGNNNPELSNIDGVSKDKKFNNSDKAENEVTENLTSDASNTNQENLEHKNEN